MSGRFGNGSNSNGQFWYGSTTNFPGFLYKKNVGVGGRRSTKFAAGGNLTTNTHQYLYNKYKPGVNGIDWLLCAMAEIVNVDRFINI